MSGEQAGALERCLEDGGVAIFPADTVYGLACDPENRFAVERLYLLKRRPLSKPSAVMFFDLELALATLPELGERTRGVISQLLPGGVSLLLANPRHCFPLACGEDPNTLGLRVPRVALLEGARAPVLQSSANRAGGLDPRRIDDVPELLRAAADLEIDGGPLPGTPSTVLDLRDYEQTGAWRVMRHGAVSEHELSRVLGGVIAFDPQSYARMIRADIPDFEGFQARVVAESGAGARRILELGIGTGETALRLLERHPQASLVGVDCNEAMLAAARASLPADRVSLMSGRFEEPLPHGPLDLVVSVLAIHHIDGPAKADLFARVREALAPGGRFVLGDVVVPEDPGQARIVLTEDFDMPSSLVDQLRWFEDAGFEARVSWSGGDLAVIVGDVR